MRILVVLVLCAVATSAQTNKGGISGTVMDPNGAAVPGATVTVTNVGTNQSTTVTTSQDGAFSVSSLEPVTYRVIVELAGFKKAVLESVKVDTASIASANVLLETGTVAETVTVTSDAPLLNTESGTTSQTITERQIQDVPLSNRSVLDLAVTAPNVSGDAGSEDADVTSGQPVPGYNLNLNGGRSGSTSILADGVNNTGVGVARAVVSFTPETVQEFTVQTSAFDAQFGNTGGGVINASTKSGTNQFHGVALWYTRNPVTNAQKWTTGNLRPPNNLRYNQVSVTLGGPVVIPKVYNGHDRTFFFFAYEPRWRRDFVVTDTLLPTDANRAGDFSGLVRIANGWVPAAVASQFNVPITAANANIYRQFDLVNGKLVPIIITGTQTFPQFVDGTVLNKIPLAYLDPVALKALEFLPHAGSYFINDAGQLANYVVNRFVQQDETRYTMRVDHQISKNNRVNVRFTKVPAVGIRGFGSDVNGNTAAYSDSKQLVVADNHIFSPTFINDLRLNYTRGVFSEDFSPEFSIKSGRNLAKELGLPSLTAGGLPLFNLSADGPNAFASIGSSGSTNNFNVEERYNINDVAYWIRGNMSWKFGVDLDHALLNVTPFFAASGGRYNFRVLNSNTNRANNTTNGGNVFASLLIGVPNNVDERQVLIPYYYRWNSGALFVQNDWKVRPNLTLNMGLRYSLQFPRIEKYNHQGVFRPDLAQSFPLATPLVVAGRTINTVLVPPFAYSGYGGRSKYVTPIEWKNFEPRFGFAWSPKRRLLGLDLASRSVVIRGGYGLSHATLTGNNRSPSPDFGASNTATATSATGSSSTADPTQPVRLSTNPPLLPSLAIDQALNIPTDGLVYLGGLAIPGFVVSNNSKVPFVQNWNLTVSLELPKKTFLEVAYVGAKGSRLFEPRVNINTRDVAFVDDLEASNVSAESTITDPLGRRSLTGGSLSVTRGSLGSQYIGFDNLFSFYDSSASSIRHAGYINLNRRVARGLTFTANYTRGKSIDTASDASPDTRTLTAPSAGGGQVTFGGSLPLDRSISSYDIKDTFASTFVYDLPIGRKRQFLSNLWGPLNQVVGGWTMSGVFRLQGGYPFLPTLSDGNRLGTTTHTIRPDIVSGVPLKNPLWNRNCPVSTTCEPYINPAAFMRPAKGSLGNAPRTLDIRGPMQRYFDVSFQKNFPLPFLGNKDGKRRVQFRADLINVFNHPNFRVNSGNAGPDWGGGASGPTETAISIAEYDAWVAADAGRAGLARTTTAGAALFTQVTNFVVNSRLPSGALPLDYFHLPVPQGFATTQPNSIDISTLNGYKLYRLRQSYSTSFGTLRELGNPRYVQLGIKIYF
jgi:hypothetical protein